MEWTRRSPAGSLTMEGCAGPDPASRYHLFDCGWIHGASNQEIYNTIANGVPGSRMVAFAGRLPDGDEDTGKSSRS